MGNRPQSTWTTHEFAWMLRSRTLCPSGLRRWTQYPLARAAWVQIPQVSYMPKCSSVFAERKSFHTARLSEATLGNIYISLCPSILCFPVWHQIGMFGAEIEIGTSRVPSELYGFEPTGIAAGAPLLNFGIALAAIGILATSNKACLFGLL